MLTSLVTGAAGFVGQHLVRELLLAGQRVIGASLDGGPPPPGLLERHELEAVQWVPLDLSAMDQVESAVSTACPAQVFHLAGQSSVSESFADVLGTWDVNATGTLRLLHALSEHAHDRVRILLVSSAEVYGPVPAEEQPIRETRHLRPTNPYGASKAAAEVAGRQYAAAAKIQVIVARSFNHTGPGQSTRFALPSWAEQLRKMARGEAEPLLRVGNLEVERDLLDVRDVVRAYRLLVEAGVSGEVYNVCSGEAHRLRDVVDEMVAISATGARVEVDPERLRPAEIPVLVGDPGRLQALGWSSRIPLRQTLTDLLAAAEAAAVPGR